MAIIKPFVAIRPDTDVADRVAALPYDVYNRAEAAVKANGESTFVQPYLDAQTNTIMVSISRLLEDKKSVISLDIELGTLQQETQAIKLNGQGYGFVCDRSGLVITHSDEKNIGSDISKGEKAVLYKKIVSKKNQTFSYKMGKKHITVFATSVMDEWYAVMIINNDVLYKKISNLIIYDVGLSVVLYMIIVVFCTMSMRVTRRTLNELDETNDELQEINDSVLQALAKTIDAKDKYTKGHSVRVAKYSKMIAGRMGKTKKEQDEIYRVALLHDMGKIRIPDAIINKPGKLTDQEFSMIKLHPEQASANIIDCVESYILKTSFFATTFNKRAIMNGCNKSNKSLCLSLKTSSKYLFVRTPSCFNGDVFFPESFIMSDIFSFSFTSGISVFLSRCCSL